MHRGDLWLRSDPDREWLDTDCTGSYSSLTESWGTRRKFHGLLVASSESGWGRKVILQNLLINGKLPYALMVRRGLTHSFYMIGMEIELLMPLYTRSVVLRTNAKSDMVITPIVNGRSIYDVSNGADRPFIGESHIEAQGVRVHITSDFPFTLDRKSEIPVGMHFDIDESRGESCDDTGYAVGVFTVPAGSHYIAFSAGRPVSDPETAFLEESERRARVMEWAPDRLKEYALSTERFLLKGGVIAGYHWFSQWGRDAMIALPGLTLIYGRFKEARDILVQYASLVEKGRFPNAMDERTGKWSYNTVDAGLWFIDRLWLYWKHRPDDRIVSELLPTCTDILDATLNGTETHMHNGVLTHPAQWTWMDASTSDGAIVPRGAAVEVQALAYAALNETAEMLDATGGDGAPLREKGEELRIGFRENFMRDGLVQDTPESDEVRANTLYTMYFPYTIITPEEYAPTFQVVRAGLHTPFGMRTLAPGSPNYRGTYLPDKDAAYHNGTIWPFISAAAARAHLKIFGSSEKEMVYEEYLAGILEGLFTNGRCPGQVAEILDAQTPHKERGAIAQAWSLAEPLSVLAYDILQYHAEPLRTLREIQ